MQTNIISRHPPPTPTSWRHDNWRSPPPPLPSYPHPHPHSAATTMMAAPAYTRPMLACPDGSFLPLIANTTTNGATVFEVDTQLCPDVQVVVRKASPVVYAASPVGMVHQANSLGTVGSGRVMGGGGGIEQVQQGLDYQQQQINSIEARHLSQVSTPLTPGHRMASQGDPKEYCTYWIRTGECDYVQTGCKYKHEMPTLDKLREIGFSRFPRWWTEKREYARPCVVVRGGEVGGGGEPRLKQDTLAIRRMIEGHLARQCKDDEKKESEFVESEVSEGSLSGGSESSVVSEKVVVPAVRRRVVIAPSSKSASATSSPAQTQATAMPATPIGAANQHTDLLDLISDAESENLQPALKAPHNSPHHESSFRQGRFIPHNEIASSAHPMEMRSPSPLHLTSQHHPAPTSAPAAPKTHTHPSASPPVGYQGRTRSSPKLQTRLAGAGKAKRIEELEAELHAFKLTSEGAGLQKSKFATSAGAVSGDGGMTEVRHKRRTRLEGVKKGVMAKAMKGLQDGREREVKAKGVAAAGVAAKASTGHAHAVPVVKGYNVLFAEAEA